MHIYGLGAYLPPSTPVYERVTLRREDIPPARQNFWEMICVSGADEHPSGMAATASAEAIADAGIEKSSVTLVLFVGTTRDYPPSWSVATEVIRTLGLPETAIGIDLTVGCLSTLAALDLASGWLRIHGGYGLIVSAEKWSAAVNRSALDQSILWGHSDGAAAVVVGHQGPRPGMLGLYKGGSFLSHADFNGIIRTKAGGTRHPFPVQGGENGREMMPVPAGQLSIVYRHCFGKAFDKVKPLLGGGDIDWIVCSQAGARIHKEFGNFFGQPTSKVVITGDKYGHVGPADIYLGLRQLRAEGRLKGNVLITNTTIYAFGCGVLQAG